MPEELERWVTKTVGIKRKLLLSLSKDDDWTFVIKMHGILEAALNHLLLAQFDNPELEKVIVKLETSNEQTGKLAFIRAYDLLPKDCRLFVKVFSEVRNSAIHDLKNTDLDLIHYPQSLDKPERRRLWRKGLCCWMPPDTSEKLRDVVLLAPREAIYNSCMLILRGCYERHSDIKTKQARVLTNARILDPRRMFRGFHEPQESSAKG